MGAWGSSLYESDTACDIRDDYVDKLKRGKSNEEITSKLIIEYVEGESDVEEIALFWFALANIQWDYGRLLPMVKEKALFFLGKKEEVSVRWQEAGEKAYKSWLETLKKLEDKLLSPMPEVKKVSKYRLYRCPWKLGDVFAYQLSGEYSKKMGLYGKYIIFRKATEDTVWPGHIVPAVQVYKWIGEEIPAVEEIEKLPLLIQNHVPKTLLYKPDIKPQYLIKLVTTSKSMVIRQNLKYITNLKGNDLVEFKGHDYLTGYRYVGWEGSGYNLCIERYVIDQYFAWTNEG